VQWDEAPPAKASKRQTAKRATLDELTTAALNLFLMPLAAQGL
jgi:hypothetical protein